MSVSEFQGKMNFFTRARKRVVRVATVALAVTATCSGLTWAAVSVTGNSVDAKPPVTCSYNLTNGAKPVGIPTFDASAAARPYTAELVTNRGTITIEALTDKAPCATNSFSFLARKGYYDGSKCHRVTTRGIYVLDCGDPKGEGAADPGYFFGDENLDGAEYSAGTVAMSVPGRNGSQFFISYADPDVPMSSEWTPFGKVVSGLDVLKEIARNGTQDGSSDGRPKKAVVIKSVTVRQTSANAPREKRG
ncbi:peptidylprolyl isomerase [Streptomyces sp. NBC_00873]|uniref:peptidylprolyl isomerase n=1 Tax=unclassified Streptomyces TaxID=2593676 RepID=UPI003864024F|nr:peptidylprolyl isomerase [Streptomyces sp. NBC_00873]WTA45888.1 peptidylprolyl isomerase [Streptomyces sp. NBC_00842]